MLPVNYSKSPNVNLFEIQRNLDTLLEEERYDEILEMINDHPITEDDKVVYGLARFHVAKRATGEEKKARLTSLNTYLEENPYPGLLGIRAGVLFQLSLFEFDPKVSQKMIDDAEGLLRDVPKETFPREWVDIGTVILLQKAILSEDISKREVLLEEALSILESFPEEMLKNDERIVLIDALIFKGLNSNVNGVRKRSIIRIEALLQQCPESNNKKVKEGGLAWLKVIDGQMSQEEALEITEKLIKDVPIEQVRDFHRITIRPKIDRALKENDISARRFKLEELEELLLKLSPPKCYHPDLLNVWFQLAFTMEGDEKKAMLSKVIERFPSFPQNAVANQIYLGALLQLAFLLEGDKKKRILEEIEPILEKHSEQEFEHLKAVVQLQFSFLNDTQDAKMKRLDKVFYHLARLPESLPHGEYIPIKADALFLKASLLENKEEARTLYRQALEVIMTVPEEERTSEEITILANILKVETELLELEFDQATQEQDSNTRQDKLSRLEKWLMKLPSIGSDHFLLGATRFKLALMMEGDEKKAMLLKVIQLYHQLPVSPNARFVYTAACFQFALLLNGREQQAKLTELEGIIHSFRTEFLTSLQATVQFRLAIFEDEIEGKRSRLTQALQLFEAIPETKSYEEYACVKAATLYQMALLEKNEDEKKARLIEAQEALTVIPEQKRNFEMRGVLDDISKELAIS